MNRQQPEKRNTPLPPRLLRFAREMRHEMTDAEKRVWHRIRDRKLSGFKFRRQVPVGDFILDFYCHEAMLAVELDGGQHNDPEGQGYDRLRDEALRKTGVLVLRFWDNDVLKNTDAVLERILEALTARVSNTPSPRPSPGGRGRNAVAASTTAASAAFPPSASTPRPGA